MVRPARLVRCLALLFGAPLAGCPAPPGDVGDLSGPATPADGPAGALTFDLDGATEPFAAGFADYAVSMEGALALEAGPRPLPAPLQGAGYMLSGNNAADDLFMFAKRRVTGLRPGARYQLAFTVSLAANAGKGCFGIGGSPGESVWVKAGASATEPAAVTVQEAGAPTRRMSIDKGNQATGGRDAIVIGDLANEAARCDGSVYQIKQLAAGPALSATAAADGSLWILVGTDSGFEGVTRVYLTRVTVIATPQG